LPNLILIVFGEHVILKAHKSQVFRFVLLHIKTTRCFKLNNGTIQLQKSNSHHSL